MKRFILIIMIFTLCLVSCGGAEERNKDVSAGRMSEDVSEETDVSAEESFESENISELLEESEEATSEESDFEPDDDELVEVSIYAENIVIDLRYATEDNFFKTKLYEENKAYLRYGTLKKLIIAEKALEEKGVYIKIWDAYRPIEAQRAMWEICPDPRYVSDPEKGTLSHTRGSALDVTLIYKDGKEVLMPTDFDDFSEKADRDYSDVSDAAAENAKMLEKVMEEAGFIGYKAEWWHYSDTDGYDIIR